MKDSLQFEAFYPHSPERVWQALTDPEALSFWLLPTDFRAQVGFRFRFSGPVRSDKDVTGEVVEVRQGERLSYTWDDGEAGSPSLVTWDLQPTDGGTKLSLQHQVLEDAPIVLIGAEMNWRGLLYASLPVMLQLMRAYPSRPPVPMVYAPDTEEDESKPKRRAGFRQEEETVCR